MIDLFFQRVHEVAPQCEVLMRGYSEAEISVIQEIYGIEIVGDFRTYLMKAGKSDGGLIGDDPIVLYREYWPPWSQVNFQSEFVSYMEEAGHSDYLKKPFVFSWESESHYFFLQTAVDGDQIVYCYNTHDDSVEDTRELFWEYMVRCLDRFPPSDIVCTGDLIGGLKP
jgi:hypothetical protein